MRQHGNIQMFSKLVDLMKNREGSLISNDKIEQRFMFILVLLGFWGFGGTVVCLALVGWICCAHVLRVLIFQVLPAHTNW